MKLQISRKSRLTEYAIPPGDFQKIIGRKAQDYVPDIDLSPDLTVSRQHARLSRQGDALWLEDLNSRKGTLLNGEQIKGAGKCTLRAGDVVQMGGTELRVEEMPQADALSAVDSDAPADPNLTGETSDQVRYSIDASSNAPADWPADVTAPLLAAHQAISIAAGRGDRPADIARQLMHLLRTLIPTADRVAMLLLDEHAQDMVLAAHEPQGDPRVSITLAKLAIDKKKTIVWSRARHGDEKSLAISIDEQQLENVLCAPLIWQGQALGVLWLSGPGAQAFTHLHAGVAVAVAQQAAMAVAADRLKQDLSANTATLKQIMAHFSPKVANRLLEQARQGRLRPGGVNSQVTLLCCDLRGFTKTAAGLSTDDVVDMLNEYFAALVAILLRHGGTIDKFIGDAILAVFGSPEPDAHQHDNAVQAAREMQQMMKQLNAQRTSRKRPALELGIGIHCGKVLHGFIGSEDRVEFTVIGDAVNKTARYCDAAAPGQILISPDLHQLVWKRVKAKPMEIQTKHEGTLTAFLLVGE